MKDDYIIYSLKLANSLINKGFQLKGVGINKNNPKYYVFFFDNTEALVEEINKFKQTAYK